MDGVYYRIISFEAGIIDTGSTKANYHCYCEILDGTKVVIPNHPLNDVYYGKWTKCKGVLSKWQKAVDKAKLKKHI